MKKLKLVLGIFAIIFALIVPGNILAQEQKPQSALSVGPAIVEYVLQPGQSKQFTLQVKNIANVPLPVTSLVRSFAVLEALPENEDERKIFDASRWFRVTEPDFILQPGQVRPVEVTINPPENATPGGHYATLYFQPLIPAEALSPNTTYLNARVGVLAFMIVAGDAREKLTLESLQSLGLRQSGPIEFNGAMKNDGNVHLLPEGRITIYDWRGRQVAELPLNPAIILPHTTKPFTATWDKRWLFGKYTAKTEVSYGTESIELKNTELVFWVIPWSIVLGIFVPLSLVMIITIKTRKRWRKAWRILRGKES